MHVVICRVHFICILWKQDRNRAIVTVLTNYLYKVGVNEVMSYEYKKTLYDDSSNSRYVSSVSCLRNE